MTTTAPQLTRILTGLKSLDGLRTRQNEFTAFHFSPEVTWVIAENQCAIADALKPYELARKTLAAKHGLSEGMAITPGNAAAVEAFVREIGELDERPLEVELKSIKRADLRLGNKDDKNAIPGTVLAALMSILE